MRRPKLRLVLGLSIPLLVIVMLLAAWAIDSSSASGKVPRNVTLDGRDISKLPEDSLAATVADLAEAYAETTVQVRTTDRTYKVPAADLGLRLDEPATVKAALELDEDTELPKRPGVWLASFLDERRAPMRFTVDEQVLEMGLATLGGNAKPTEPQVVATGSGFGIISGSSGRRISSGRVRAQLLRRASSGEEPIVVDTEAVDSAPLVSDAAAKEVADRLSLVTARGLAVKVGLLSATIPAATVRSWVGARIAKGELEVTLDAKRATGDLIKAFPGVTKVKDASITLAGFGVQIVPSVTGQKCCAADTPARLLEAVNVGRGQVTLALQVDKPRFSTEDAVKLGIKEPVGGLTEWNGQPQVKGFTTYFPCCAPRVTNIRRIADLVRGTIVKPGEKFSVNAVVGERTVAKGFVLAGAISEGEHVDEVGGGVSQFATTMFNAAFFAGLDITEYQAHSEYFDRYPRGREATMGFPDPDMAWKNDTPYGILIWTSSTETSVTVQLWSTQFAYGQQTGQTEGRAGRCTTVATQRIIHYPDGRTADDEFKARYRPSGATTC